jgi:long-chain fatty acid transport protein
MRSAQGVPGRRLRVVVIACLSTLALPAHTAFAHGNGTLFSSPVDSDGAAVYWNPAAMAGANESRFDAVGNVQLPQATYQRYGTDAQQGGAAYPKVSLLVPAPEPTVGLIIDKVWRKRLRLGFGVTVPNASGAGWPETVSQNHQVVLGPTRYATTNAQVFNVYTQLAASFLLHRTFAIGVAATMIISSLDDHKDTDLANTPPLSTTVPCAANPFGCENPQLSAPTHFKGVGVSGGATIGIFWRPIPRVRIGAAYLTPAKIDMKATVSVDASKLNTFAQQFYPGFTPLSVNGSGTAIVKAPMQVHAGIAVDVTSRVELMAMMRWVNTAASEIISATLTKRSSSLVPTTINNPSVTNDQWMVAARVVGRIRDRWKLAFGVEYVTATTPDAYTTPANIDFNSIALNFGANVRITKHLALGASFSQFVVIPRTITASAYSNDAGAPYNLPDPSGHYTANSETVGLDLTAFF